MQGLDLQRHMASLTFSVQPTPRPGWSTALTQSSAWGLPAQRVSTPLEN
jgi:hypothetical protein